MLREAAVRGIPAFAVLLFACGGAAPSMGNPGSGGAVRESHTPRCRDASTGTEQLAVGWTVEERADLEAASRRGVVVVRYANCELEVMRDCHVKGAYEFQPAPMKDDQLVLTSDAELEHWMPDQARRLSSEMRAAGGLIIRMATVGRRATTLPSVAPADLIGACDGATHFVASMSVGAFEMSTGPGESASPNPDPPESPARGRTMTKSGDREACGEPPSTTRPPERCAEILRVELAPIGATRAPDFVETQAPAPSVPPPSEPRPAEPGDPEYGRK